ncbi:hypothetical protein DES49_1202 [Halospina denitrificans]|uniref:Outer membrane protein with beta-barrel domain n=1 Tax=Halospina denitrificans TaxID=332522 RepID=A0A4V3ERG7_9GAMM|nr:hypothetical protein [Halospina denitrificans]TDT43388.1 hypothetical protein DES49_1202 [Halospina denitrificans]
MKAGMRYCRLLMSSILLLAATLPQAFAQTNLERGKLGALMVEGMESAETWRWGWAAFFAGSATYNLYLGTSADDPDDRYDGRVGAVTAGLGLIDTLITTPPQTQAYRDYHALSHDDRDTSDKASAIAREAAGSEARLRGWRGRIGSLIVNAGAYAAIAEGDDRPDDGLRTAAIGLLVNEFKLWTAPTTFSDASEITMGRTTIPIQSNIYATRHGIGLSVRF